MDYAVVIATLNREKLIGRAIDSVFKQRIKPKEFIIMLDAASNIENIDILLSYKRKYPIIKIYNIKNRIGALALINLGVKKAGLGIILNMDDDAELLGENWIENAFQELKKKRVALVWGIKGIPPNTKYGNFIAQAYLFKKDIYEQVGGFPDNFFIYDNEIDLTIRLHIAGVYPYYSEKLDTNHGLEHLGAKSSINWGKTYIYYDFSNRLFIYWKYYPIYFAFLLSIFHFIQTMRFYAIEFKEYFGPFRALKRFLNNFYVVVYKNRKVLPVKQFFKICYQMKFPFSIYWFLEKLH